MKSIQGQTADRWYAGLFSEKTLTGIMVLGALVFVVSMWNRYIYIDDAFFGEQAYWLAKDGVVKTVTLIDFLGCDVRLFSYHKLNIMVGAALIRLFGWSVNPLRFTTLLFFLGFVATYVTYFKQNRPNFGREKQQMTIALFLIVFNPLIVLYAFTFRPEIWVMFFGFLSYMLLEKSIKKEDSIPYILLAGVLSGLAFLTHLNGLIFSVAGFVVLAFARKWRSVLMFSVSAGTTSLLYFFDLWQKGHLATWLYQIRNWPDNNATNYLSENIGDFLMNVVVKLSEEHQRFFWSDRVWVISTFFILAILFNFRYLVSKHRLLAGYTLTLILALNIAGSQIAERFLIYLFPFMALIISFELTHIVKKAMPVRKTIYMLLLLLQVILVAKMFVGIFQKNGPQVQVTHEIMSHIHDKNARTLVPYTMIYNALDEYNLVSYKAFEYYQVQVKHELSQKEFFSRANNLKIQNIVVPLKKLKNSDTGLTCIASGTITDTTYYAPFYHDDRCIILKRKRPENLEGKE